MTEPLTLMVDEVSSKPPNTVPLLFSELSSPVLQSRTENGESENRGDHDESDALYGRFKTGDSFLVGLQLSRST